MSAEQEEIARLREALEFYASAWNFKTNKRYGGLEWSPTESLLDDCGNRAKEALRTRHPLPLSMEALGVHRMTPEDEAESARQIERAMRKS